MGGRRKPRYFTMEALVMRETDQGRKASSVGLGNKEHDLWVNLLSGERWARQWVSRDDQGVIPASEAAGLMARPGHLQS